jgi:hypothetical protein
MLAYYQLNKRYPIDKTIGQIRSAAFLENYLNKPQQLIFATFPKQMYIAHHTNTSNNID